MRTIQETINAGINSPAEIEEALQTAIQLEFSTIPPYLCAEWSINTDPSNVSSIVHGVVVQEMLHFGLACNMLTAIGGSPSIANASFVPNYPGPLPGGVHPGLVVDLLPMGLPALTTFLQIEYPDNGSIVANPPPPPAPQPPTIGEFYDTISAGFQAVYPNGTFPNPVSHQVTTSVDDDQLIAVTNVADALNAISEIKDQGEGTSLTPDEANFDPKELAHYYAFSQVYFGKTLINVPGQGIQYSDPPITMPTVYSFSSQPGASQAQFSAAFTKLLTQLQACWTNGVNIHTAIGTMFALQTAGSALIQAGVRPQFTFQNG